MKGIRINMKKIKNNLLSLRIILKELEYKHVFAWITLIFFVAILTPCITWLYKLLIDYFSHENTSPVNIILLVVIYVIAQFLQESIENLQSNFAVKLNYRLNNRINYIINKKLSVIRAELYEDKAVFDLISRVRENITFETINTFGNVLALFMMIITTITVALKHVSMEVKKGDIYGFIGENGAGKTTMIRILTGLAFPSSGEISLFGKVGNDLSKERKKIGSIIESPALYLEMTAKENLEVQMLQKGVGSKKDIASLLRTVGLEEAGRKKAKNFSLGMRQRLALAIALINNPDFLVLDEPTNGLDPTGIMEIRNLLLRLNQEKGTTILISTHILSELHLLATSYGILSKGTLVKQMTAKELDEACEKYLEIEVDDSAKALDILEKNFASICTETVGIGKLIIRNYDQETARLLLILSKNGVQVKNMQNVTETLEEYYSKLI